MAVGLAQKNQVQKILLVLVVVGVISAVFISGLFVLKLVSAEILISAALAYSLFLVGWLLQAYYIFRYQGAQQIKKILYGFYFGGALKILLTLIVVMILLRGWPSEWPAINWLVFLLVLLFGYVLAGMGALFQPL